MRMIDHHGIRLATEAFGRPGDPVVLLAMGATESMLGWTDEFCTALAAQELHVIRFDHRDTGASTTVPPGEASYAAEDMAGDMLAILDGYGAGVAHLVGMSLGGYLAQMMAVDHPDRVASLTLIASEPLGWDGDPLPHISEEFLVHFAALGSLDWSDRGAVAGFLLESGRLCAGPAAPFDAVRERARIERGLSRTDSPASMFNHATLAPRRDWTGRFRDITCPVLVLHGDRDPILPVENGQALASGIAGAALTILPGVGHEIPMTMTSRIARRIADHVREALDQQVSRIAPRA